MEPRFLVSSPPPLMELWRSVTGREQMEDWRVRSEFAEEEDAITREDAMNRGFRSPIAGDGG